MGICILYENNTSNKQLDESLFIEGSGIEILADRKDSSTSLSNQIKFKLNPNEDYFVQLKALEKNWTAKTKYSFTVEIL